MTKSRISWTDATWNPIVGCSKVSQGCDHCWAERMARLHYHDKFSEGWNGEILHFPYRISEFLHRQKPARIAVGLMGDLFHEKVDFRFIEKVFEVMREKESFEFQLLTKRPKRVLDFWTWRCTEWLSPSQQSVWPKHVWLGVSCENQEAADERIPLLLQTPAAVRFVSVEPMLAPVDLTQVPNPGFGEGQRYYDALEGSAWYVSPDEKYYDGCPCEEKLDWVICGGESGPGARPLHPNWVRSLRDQCLKACVPFHFEQHGEWIDFHNLQDRPFPMSNPYPKIYRWDDGTYCFRVGKKYAGHILDGKELLEFPNQ